jgi:hypothetical protein
MRNAGISTDLLLLTKTTTSELPTIRPELKKTSLRS